MKYSLGFLFKAYILCFMLFSLFSGSNQAYRKEKKIFKISVFYNDTYDNIEDLVSYSVDITNRILKSSTFQFEYTITRVYDFESYAVTKTLCKELDDGRIAILAIGDNPIFSHLNMIANSLRIPFIYIKWNNLEDEHEKLNSVGNEDDVAQLNYINIHPPAHKLMKGIIDLINYYKWEYVTVLYQESLGLGRIEDLIRMPLTAVFNSKFRLQVRQLNSDVKHWIYMLKDVKLSGSSHIIVDIETRYLNVFLEQAEEVGLMTSYFHLMFTSFDLAVLEYSPSANVTGFQIYEPNETSVKSIFAEFNLKNMVSQKPMFKFMPSEAVLIHDAFTLLANTIDRHNLAETLPATPTASCQKENPWLFGMDFMRFLRMSNFNGLSGHVEFDQTTGYRNNITLSIVDRTRAGVDLFGYWRDQPTKANKPIDVVRSYAKEKDQVLDKLNRHLKVTTKLEAPYIMRRVLVDNQTLTGNAQYKGFCVELLDKIAQICKFNYTIQLVEDGFMGSFVNGKWNGIVSELIDKKADLAVAGLTISYQREQVIDFTIPFLNLGISILYKRPQKKTPELFAFLSPLSVELWIYMSAAYLGVTFMLFVLGRFSPYEWDNPHPCNPDSGITVNQFTLLNSFWLTMGSLMHQGSDVNPKSPSTRLITIVWAFFTLIIISSYTANLAAFLTVQRMQTPIENVEDLSRQTEIKYGSQKSGSTENFFKESKIQTYERMWNFMRMNPDVMVKSTEEGIRRVKAGGYAYLLESITNEYLRQRDCELMQIGGLLDSKGYGIGTPPGSPWRDQISNAILQLQEKGDIQELYTKWWEKEEKDPNQKCDNTDEKKDSLNELSLAYVGGVFLSVAGCLVLSLLVAFLEFMWQARKNSKYDGKRTFHHFSRGFKSIMSNFFETEFQNPFFVYKPEYDQKKSVDRSTSFSDSDSHRVYLKAVQKGELKVYDESTDETDPLNESITNNQFIFQQQELSKLDISQNFLYNIMNHVPSTDVEEDSLNNKDNVKNRGIKNNKKMDSNL